ncbi:hypothetical protein KCP69_11350 [Salmonella enterica subsp. enterica]|nr:hypothetical protein KCP69_11350 [Salmonella enterica subsp. enterica]
MSMVDTSQRAGIFAWTRQIHCLGGERQHPRLTGSPGWRRSQSAPAGDRRQSSIFGSSDPPQSAPDRGSATAVPEDNNGNRPLADFSCSPNAR